MTYEEAGVNPFQRKRSFPIRPGMPPKFGATRNAHSGRISMDSAIRPLDAPTVSNLNTGNASCTITSSSVPNSEYDFPAVIKQNHGKVFIFSGLNNNNTGQISVHITDGRNVNYRMPLGLPSTSSVQRPIHSGPRLPATRCAPFIPQNTSRPPPPPMLRAFRRPAPTQSQPPVVQKPQIERPKVGAHGAMNQAFGIVEEMQFRDHKYP